MYAKISRTKFQTIIDKYAEMTIVSREQVIACISSNFPAYTQNFMYNKKDLLVDIMYVGSIKFFFIMILSGPVDQIFVLRIILT